MNKVIKKISFQIYTQFDRLTVLQNTISAGQKYHFERLKYNGLIYQ